MNEENINTEPEQPPQNIPEQIIRSGENVDEIDQKGISPGIRKAIIP